MLSPRNWTRSHDVNFSVKRVLAAMHLSNALYFSRLYGKYPMDGFDEKVALKSALASASALVNIRLSYNTILAMRIATTKRLRVILGGGEQKVCALTLSVDSVDSM